MSIRSMVEEGRILKMLNHTNIINFIDKFIQEEDGTVCIVMEYAEGNILYTFNKYRRRPSIVSSKFKN